MKKEHRKFNLKTLLLSGFIAPIIGLIIFFSFMNYQDTSIANKVKEQYTMVFSYQDNAFKGTYSSSLSDVKRAMDAKTFHIEDAKLSWNDVIIYRNSETSDLFFNTYTIYFPDGSSLTSAGKIVAKGSHAVMVQTNEGIYITSSKNIAVD